MFFRKRGQAWGFDLIMASIIFLGSIVVFYLYSLNYPTEGKENSDILFYEGSLISEALLSEGFPTNWDKNNVIRIGILSDDKINETKLERLYNLSIGDYSRTKNLFNTKYDFFIYFSEDMIINGTVVPGIGQNSSNPESLIKITRFSVYKDKPISLYVEVWK